jgi:membrane-bound serine protease (ClpP class)
VSPHPVVTPEVAVALVPNRAPALLPLLAQSDGTTLLDSFVQWLDNPTVAFLLLALGITSVMVEIAHPGILGTGIGGVVAILLGLWSLSMQSVNMAGFALITLAALLFLAELFSPTTGLAALGGTVALLAGGLLLIDDPVEGGVPAVVVLPASAVIGTAVVVAGRIALRVRDRPPLSGPDGLIGRPVVVEQVIDEAGLSGRTFTEGAWWQVRTSGAQLRPGAPARIVAVDGLVLVVVPTHEEPSGKEAP